MSPRNIKCTQKQHDFIIVFVNFAFVFFASSEPEHFHFNNKYCFAATTAAVAVNVLFYIICDFICVCVSLSNLSILRMKKKWNKFYFVNHVIWRSFCFIQMQIIKKNSHKTGHFIQFSQPNDDATQLTNIQINRSKYSVHRMCVHTNIIKCQ